jgi:hypothetical protein
MWASRMGILSRVLPDPLAVLRNPSIYSQQLLYIFKNCPIPTRTLIEEPNFWELLLLHNSCSWPTALTGHGTPHLGYIQTIQGQEGIYKQTQQEKCRQRLRSIDWRKHPQYL